MESINQGPIPKTESSAVNSYNGMFGQQGWICPKCGRVYSPFTQMCLYCKPNNTATVSNLGNELIRLSAKKN